MAQYAERDNYNDEVNALVKKCKELNLVCTIKHNRYPFTVICEPDMAMDAQISMLDNEAGHNGKGDGFVIRFTGEEPATDVNFRGFTNNLVAIFKQAKKVHVAFTAMFFREVMDAQATGRAAYNYEDEDDVAQQLLLDDALPDDVEDTADELAGMTDEPE